MQESLELFKEQILDVTSKKTNLRIRGSGTKDWYGQDFVGEILDTSKYSGILSYDPSELVLTAKCGTTLREIGKSLSSKNQMLAFEPPRFDGLATLGGIVASGLSGPRRFKVGAVRDFILGLVLMNGKGEILNFGGQVMKNVAGYDVSRLITGSLGTLGLILEVSIKVLPKPLKQSSLEFDLTEEEAIKKLNIWASKPLPISASCWTNGHLIIRLSGAESAVNSAREKLGGEELRDCDKFWNTVREQTHSYFKSINEGLWKISIPASSPPLRISGEQLIEWGGALRWLKTSEEAKKIRVLAESLKGSATLFRGGDKSVGVFHPLDTKVKKIHKNLKNVFDPSRIFNIGRMYKDL